VDRSTKCPLDAEPVYLPHNEPYLGSKSLLEFDMAIPRVMQVHAAIGPTTFFRELSPLQRCATEIIPQGVSIAALSIRELIRQASMTNRATTIAPLFAHLLYLEARGLLSQSKQTRSV
jgi:hypothetical protein